MVFTFLVCFLSISMASTEFILRPKNPPLSIETLKETPGEPLILRCVTTSGAGNQQWVIKGSDRKENYGTLTVEGTDSILTVQSFDPKLHAGLYECEEGQFIASVKIESNIDPPLPKGFRPCEDDEPDRCIHGSCGIDSINQKTCFCAPMWSGPRCDTIHSMVRQRPRNTDCLIWIIVGGVIIGCVVVFIIIVTTFFFCPVKQCQHVKELERGTSLLEQEPKVEDEV